MPGNLYRGDNLTILRDLEPNSVNLVYLDPPFNSNRDYSFTSKSGPPKVAFTDTWKWDNHAEKAFAEASGYGSSKVPISPSLRIVMQMMKELLGKDLGMLAYLSFMALRLVELHRVLRDDGSLYLHCDSSASHSIKIVLDGIFGIQNFQTEIVWKRASSHGSATRSLGRVHDTIFFYTKSENPLWNEPAADSNGDPIGNLWIDILPLNTCAKERSGYPTQKPVALLERIIQASSNPGGLVLDPFAGSGTTLEAAESLNRRWIGIDMGDQAIETITKRLTKKFGSEVLSFHDTTADNVSVPKPVTVSREDEDDPAAITDVAELFS